MTTKHRLVDALRIQQAGQVITEDLHVILRQVYRPASHAKTALIRRDSMITSRTYCLDLAAPTEGQFWPAMTKHDSRTIPLLVDGHINTIGLYKCRRRHHRRRHDTIALRGE